MLIEFDIWTKLQMNILFLDNDLLGQKVCYSLLLLLFTDLFNESQYSRIIFIFYHVLSIN